MSERINNAMEYNDEKLCENFEAMARAYSKSLKNKGFVFIKLEDEEFSMLLDEIMVLFGKIEGCLERLGEYANCQLLKEETKKDVENFRQKFKRGCNRRYHCTTNPSECFLSLISLENTLTLKLMILSVKSGELEFCHDIITSRTRIYANSFSQEGFVTY